MAYDKIIDSQALDNTFIQIADAIRVKNGTTNKYKDSEMAQAIRDIPTGGDTSIEDAIISKTLTEYSNDRVETVGDYTFYNSETLTSAELANCKEIGEYAFSNCTALEQISCPECENIKNYAFENCISLKSADFPNCIHLMKEVNLNG